MEALKINKSLWSLLRLLRMPHRPAPTARLRQAETRAELPRMRPTLHLRYLQTRHPSQTAQIRLAAVAGGYAAVPTRAAHLLRQLSIQTEGRLGTPIVRVERQIKLRTNRRTAHCLPPRNRPLPAGHGLYSARDKPV